MISLLLALQVWAAKPEIQFQHDESLGYVFDLPVTYNPQIQKWVHFYQTTGRKWFITWLSRGEIHMPRLKMLLAEAGLPQDLAYVAMIESGLSVHATSTAAAVGPWQFIKPTATRFGLTVNWWLDERRDFYKSTQAAIKYLKYLHERFDCWYLAAAAYNTGEGRISRLIKKYNTRNFWELANSKNLATETKQYIPKLVATMLMAKTPHLYGFTNIPSAKEVDSESFYVPGGTHLDEVAEHLKLTKKSLYDMNAALIKRHVPAGVSGYHIRIPKGASQTLGLYIAKKHEDTKLSN